MKKVAVTLAIFLLIFGSLTISVGQIAKGSNIKEKVEEERTASLQEMDLSDYIPKNIEGFDEEDSWSADDDALGVWDAESGRLSWWGASDTSDDVNYHNLRIDLYKFDTNEEASEAIIDGMKKYGEVSVETLEGFPLMIATGEHEYEDGNGASVYIGYYQDDFIISIRLNKEMTDDTASSDQLDQLLEEGEQAFRAIVEQGEGESDK